MFFTASGPVQASRHEILPRSICQCQASEPGGMRSCLDHSGTVKLFKACVAEHRGSLHAGWVDPVLATSLGADNPVAQVALQFAWESQGAPEARFGVDVTQLSPKMSPLIGSRRVDTGKARATIPSQVGSSSLCPADQMLLMQRSTCSNPISSLPSMQP